jgi:alpha-tubulin suppressor-like RCC1 family protein
MHLPQHRLPYAFALTAFLLGGCGAGHQDAGQGTSSGGERMLAAVAQVPLSSPIHDTDRIFASGEFVLGLNTNGIVYAWGANSYGQLGSGNLRLTAVPGPVVGLSGVRAVQAGVYHSLALTRDGGVRAWGVNTAGQLGTVVKGSFTMLPVLVSGLSAVKVIAAGGTHSAAVVADGSVWGWGRMSGRSSAAPAKVYELQAIRTVVSGDDFNLAIKNDGSLWGWGSNTSGQLGIGRQGGSFYTPMQITLAKNVVAVSAGQAHALALRVDGSVWGWGSNLHGQLGIPASMSLAPRQVVGLPVPVNGASGVKAVVTGTYNSAVLYADGSVWAWGDNSAGQLGLGNRTQTSAAVRIKSVANVVAVGLGDRFITLLSADGAVYGIGANSSGQLGNNTTTGSLVPVQAVGIGGYGNLNLGKSTGE